MGPGPRVANLPFRLVIDTNVLVSALVIRSGALSQLPGYRQNRCFIPLASSSTLTELANTLAAPKFGLSASQITGLLAEYIPWCDILDIATPPLVPECRDPNDHAFLELAAFANADTLVTGDLDILDLQPFFEIPIMTPRSMLSLLQTTD